MTDILKHRNLTKAPRLAAQRGIATKATRRMRAFCLAICASAASIPAITYAQNKIAMPPLPAEDATQFGAIGRVNNAGFKAKGMCTGTLIRPDVVLTAAHCTHSDPFAQTNKIFVAGWERGKYIAARRVTEQRRHPAFGHMDEADPRYDIGLLFLEQPITEVPPVPLTVDAADAVALAGYHRVAPHLLSGKIDCPVAQRAPGILLIDCPVVSGNSGGPVLEPAESGGWSISAVVTFSAGKQAIATRIPQWVLDTLAERDRATDS